MESHSFNVEHAILFTQEGATLLQHHYYWYKRNKANNRNFHDGSYWTFNAASAYCDIFPYLSEKQVRTLHQNFIDAGLMIEGNYNQTKFDRTKWFALTELGISCFTEWNIHKVYSNLQKVKWILQNVKSKSLKVNSCLQKGITIPVVNTDINTNNEVTPNIDKSILEVTAKVDKSTLPASYSEDFVLDGSLVIDNSPTAWQVINFDNPHDIKELCAKWLGDDSLLNYKGILAVDFDAKRNTPKGRMSEETYFGKIYNMWFCSKDESKLKNDKGESKNVGIVFSSISPDVSMFHCFNFYLDFYKAETGLPAKVANSDMGLIESIIAYLRKINKKPTFNAACAFKGLLNNLPSFYKTAGQLKLIKLSQNLEAIIQKIREANKAPKAMPALSPADAKDAAIKGLADLGLTAEMIAYLQSNACVSLRTAKAHTTVVLYRAGKYDGSDANNAKYTQCLKVLRPTLR